MQSALLRGRWRKPSILPGFGPTLGLTLTYVSLIVLIPLAALVLRTLGHGWAGVVDVMLRPRVLAAFRVSLLCSVGAACICALPVC